MELGPFEKNHIVTTGPPIHASVWKHHTQKQVDSQEEHSWETAGGGGWKAQAHEDPKEFGIQHCGDAN